MRTKLHASKQSRAHASLQALLPAVKMHRRELSIIWVLDEDVETLALVYESATVSSHVDEGALLDFPRRAIKLLQVGWNLRDVL